MIRFIEFLFYEEFKFTQLPISWEDRGIRKGLVQAKEEVALKMLKEGLSMDIITKVTDLDKEAIEKLKELNWCSGSRDWHREGAKDAFSFLLFHKRKEMGD